MKNTQKGFIIPLLIVIIAVLVIGGGVYYIYLNGQALSIQPPTINDRIVSTSSTQTKQNPQTNQQSPHIDSVTPFVDSNGNMQFSVKGSGFLGSNPYVDGQSATHGADVTDTGVTLLSVKQLAVPGNHSVYLTNPTTGKSNIFSFQSVAAKSNLKTYTNTQYGFGFKYGSSEVIKERSFVNGGMNNFEAKTDSITVQYSPRQCGWPGYPKDNIMAYGFGKPDLDKTITLTNGYVAHVAGTKTCTECSNPDIKKPVLQATILSKNSGSLLTTSVSGKGDLQESANFLISSVLPTISLTPVFESFKCLP